MPKNSRMTTHPKVKPQLQEGDARISDESLKYVSVGYKKVTFQVGVQSFQIGEERETQEEAEWMANILRIAITNLISEVRAKDTTHADK